MFKLYKLLKPAVVVVPVIITALAFGHAVSTTAQQRFDAALRDAASADPSTCLHGLRALESLQKNTREKRLQVARLTSEIIRKTRATKSDATPHPVPSDVQYAVRVLASLHIDEDHPDPAIDISESDLRNAQLYKGDFRGIAMSGVHLAGADLSYATFTGADMRWVTLTGAKVEGTVFCGTDLVQTTGLTEASFVNTIRDSATKPPLRFEVR